MKPKIENIDGYNISIQGRHVQVTAPISDYIFEKLAKIERFSTRIIDAHVILDVQKLEHRVDVVLKFNNFKVKVHGISENMYASIDQAMDKLQACVRKYKEKLIDHQKKGSLVEIMDLDVFLRDEDDFNADIEAANAKAEKERYKLHKVVRKEQRPLKTLTHDEAIMKLELSQDNFLLFKSEEDRKLKVMYRMKDGNFGVMTPV